MFKIRRTVARVNDELPDCKAYALQVVVLVLHNEEYIKQENTVPDKMSGQKMHKTTKIKKLLIS